MRRFLVLLMIVLLPLRGMAGDLMRIEMMQSAAASSQAAAMPPACLMHAQALNAAGDGKHAPTGQQGSCSCDLCLPLVELAETVFEIVTFARHAQPSLAGASFQSAAAAPSFKPPIS